MREPSQEMLKKIQKFSGKPTNPTPDKTPKTPSYNDTIRNLGPRANEWVSSADIQSAFNEKPTAEKEPKKPTKQAPSRWDEPQIVDPRDLLNRDS